MSTMYFMERGLKEGNDLVRNILALGVSKYRMARDLGISETQVRNWVLDLQSPSKQNYYNLIRYRDHVMMQKALPHFEPK